MCKGLSDSYLKFFFLNVHIIIALNITQEGLPGQCYLNYLIFSDFLRCS